MQVPYKPSRQQTGDSFEPIPVGEAVDMDWAAWAEAVGCKDNQLTDFKLTDALAIKPLEDGFLTVLA